MPERLFCGVDGGGSKTRIALYDAAGQQLGLTIAGPTSLTLRGPQAWDVILDALRGLCAAISHDPDDFRDMHFGIGLAGVNNGDQRAAFIDAAPAVGALHVATDSYIAALGAHQGKPGAIIIVGTGSVGYRIDAGGGSRLVGGWGFPVGDEGSGAWLGRAALVQALHAFEGRLPGGATELHRALIERCGPTRDEMMGWLLGAASTKYAALAPLVIDCAGRDDPAALELAAAAGKEIDALAVALDPARVIPLSLVGGLAEPLAPYLPAPLRNWVRAPHDEPIAGALMLAQGRAPEESLAWGGD
ncbi:MAG: ATPase [Alphaproteobacteria bacterium]|nr:ATPase [Alphaproteobacteria bacterium]